MKLYKINYLIDFFDGEPLECLDTIKAHTAREAIEKTFSLFVTNETACELVSIEEA